MTSVQDVGISPLFLAAPKVTMKKGIGFGSAFRF
jgi:hypothetical protein